MHKLLRRLLGEQNVAHHLFTRQIVHARLIIDLFLNQRRMDIGGTDGVFFRMLDTLNPTIIFFAIVLGAVPHAIVFGAQASLIAEQFTPRLRYSGPSIGYQLASVIAGGPAPLIATALLAQYKSGAVVGLYMAICAIIGFVATLFLREYSGRDVSSEYEHVGRSTDPTAS